MARKHKVGLDYFPHDCNYDDELKFIIAKHKEIGYYIYFETLKKIYLGFGYYMQSNEKSLTILAGEIGVGINKLLEVIDDCVKENLFDNRSRKELNVLTSRGIQLRYFEAIKRRKSVDIINEYILVDYVDILGEDVGINLLNVDRSTQSKVKESKVKKMKEDMFAEFWNKYPRKESKKKAKEKFLKLNQELYNTIMYALDYQTQSQKWKDGIIPHAVTWLNQERWDDVILEPQNKNNIVKIGDFSEESLAKDKYAGLYE